MNSQYSRCWANYRKDCAQGLSVEHLISKSVFTEKTIYVSGFPWCRNAEHRVGINSLRRRILCRKHNSELSPADEAGKLACRAFEAGHASEALGGLLLERWLLKTAINLSLDGGLHLGVGMTDSQLGRPSPYLTAVAFGDLPFSAMMGAYFLFPSGRCMHRVGEMSFAPLHRDGRISGFLFGLFGQYVFLNVFPGNTPPCISDLVPGLLPEPLGSAKLAYRPELILISSDNDEFRHIEIEWLRP